VDRRRRNVGVEEEDRLHGHTSTNNFVSALGEYASWGYFDFRPGTALKAETAALPTTERCYACHRDNTAVENTFVQFYPTLMDVAKRMGTVKPTYDPARRVESR